VCFFMGLTEGRGSVKGGHSYLLEWLLYTPIDFRYPSHLNPEHFTRRNATGWCAFSKVMSMGLR
jgi:hypothetical protein